MTHETEIIEYKKLSNGQFGIAVRCCGDESHVSWHTVDSILLSSPEKLEQSLAEHHKRVAQHHEASLQAETFLQSMKGAKVKHG